MVKLLETTVSDLKNIVNIIQAGGRSEEVVFVINKEGFKCNVLDPSHVAMIDLHLEPAYFTKFSAEKEYQIALDLKKFMTALKFLKSEQAIDLEYMVKENKLRIRSGGTELSFGLFDPEVSEPRMPKLDLSAKIGIAADRFLNALTAAALVSELVTINIGDKLVVTAESDKDAIKTEVPAGQLEEVEGEGVSQYDLDYLTSMIRALEGNLIVKMDTDKPITVDFRIGEWAKGLYFLAPRVEGD